MKSHLTILSVVLACFLLTLCSKDNPTAPEPDPDPDENIVSKEIGPDGGTITSSDGRLTLDIPDGALSGTEEITIEVLDDDNVPPEFEGLEADNTYELGPDGLAFDKPVSVNFKSKQKKIQNSDSIGVYGEFLFTYLDGSVEALDSLYTIIDKDSEFVTTRGQLTHFSPLTSVQGNNGVSFFVYDVPEMIEVGSEFKVRAIVGSSDGGPLADLVSIGEPATYADESGEPIFPVFNPLAQNLPKNENGNFEKSFPYTCNNIGLGIFGADLSVQVEFDLDSGPVQAESFADFITTIECVEAMSVLSVQLEGEGSGNVSSDPQGINCPEESCEANFVDGREITLKATPDENSAFTGWGGEAPDDCGNNPECVFVVTDSTNEFTAKFDPAENVIPQIIEFSGELGSNTSQFLFDLLFKFNGTIGDVQGNVDFGDGHSMEIDNFDNEGNNEYSWHGSHDYEEVETHIIKMKLVSSDGSESINLELKPFKVTVEKGGQGSGTIRGIDNFGDEFIVCDPNCEVKTDSLFGQIGDKLTGIDFTLTATPGPDSDFIDWGGDAVSCGSDPICENILLGKDKTAIAFFEPKQSNQEGIINTGVTGPENTAIIPNPWGEMSFNSSSTYLLVVSGDNGMSIVDHGTGEATFFPLPSGSSGSVFAQNRQTASELFGVLPLEPFEDAFGSGFRNWLLAYGDAGWYLQEVQVDENGNPQPGDIRPPEGPSESVTTAAIGTGGIDGTDGGSASPIITEAANGRIVEERNFNGSTDLSNDVFDHEVLLDVNEGDFPNINSAPIAAYRQTRTERGDLGDIIVATQGIGSDEPGQLYFTATDITGDAYFSASFVDTLGFDVRSIECQENPKRDRELTEGEAQILCFTYNFGSNSLSPYMHFADNRGLTILDEILVNNGPVSGDSRLVNNDSAVEVLSTGFNDGGIFINQMDFMGNHIAGASGTVPSACLNPGAIRYNPENPDEAFVSCNGSDNVAIVDLAVIRAGF